MSNRRFAGFWTGLLILAVAALGGPALAQGEAAAYVVHGIPGADAGSDDPALPVDVLVDDALCLLRGFSFGEVAGPVMLAEGTYNIKILASSEETPCEGDLLIQADVPFAAGENASVVAHLTADGMPTASKFVNDVSMTEPGMSRLLAHHVAAAPMVDLAVRRDLPDSPGAVVTRFTNGDQAAAELRPGMWNVFVNEPGSNVILYGPIPVHLRPFTVHLTYAVGSVANGTFQLIEKRVLVKIKRQPQPRMLHHERAREQFHRGR